MGGYYDENYNFIETNGGPMFVEDITRNIATELNNYLDKTIFDYTIIVNNQESIHSDNIMATAVKTAGRRLT
jgi:GTP cyclohydrolase FolE2